MSTIDWTKVNNGEFTATRHDGITATLVGNRHANPNRRGYKDWTLTVDGRELATGKREEMMVLFEEHAEPVAEPEPVTADAAEVADLTPKERKRALGTALHALAGEFIANYEPVAGLDRDEAAAQLAAWLKYVPTNAWHDALPKP